jgi:hypothetical protein
MGVANVEGDGVKIGAPSHVVRNLGILLAALVSVLAVWAWQKSGDKRDLVKLAGFDSFRAVYADKCGVPAYAEAQPEVVNNAYVDSPALQTALAKQQTVLEAQGTNACFDVAKELRGIDFVVPKPGSGL